MRFEPFVVERVMLVAGSAGAAPITWTDALTAIGTVGATIAAVIGLLLNQQSAKRDRQNAAMELAAERQRSERRYLLTTLSLVTEAFTAYQSYGTEDERGKVAFRKLRVYLNILPDDMATLVRHELGIAMAEKSEQTLLSFAENRGWTLNPEAVRRGTFEPASRWAYEELAANSSRIVMTASPNQGDRRADRFRPEDPDL